MPEFPAQATGPILRHVRVAAAAALLALVASCDDADAGALRLTDGDSAASTTLASAQAPTDEVTSEDYRKWLVAQQALDSIPGLELPSRVSLSQFDAADVGRVEDYLSSRPDARAAIERAGLSVKDYVETSVALERTVALAQGAPAAPTADTTLLRAPVPGEDGPTFQRVWTGRRLRVVEADEHDSERRWRGDDSESRREAKRARKEWKRQAKARAKRERHGHRGRH